MGTFFGTKITGAVRLTGLLCVIAVGACGCASQSSSAAATAAETAAGDNPSTEEQAQGESSDDLSASAAETTESTEVAENLSSEASGAAAGSSEAGTSETGNSTANNSEAGTSESNSSDADNSTVNASELDTSDAGSSEAGNSWEDPAITERNETIFFTVDGTNIYLDETLQELAASGLSFTYHDNITGTDVPVDEAYCNTSYNGSVITITVTDSSGNPVSVSLWNRWTDEDPETFGELTVMNIGIAEPAPTSWSKASTGPYGIYIGMPQSDLISAAGEPESHVQFVKSPEWLYTGDNYTMTINVSSGVVRGIWIENAVKTSHES